MDRNSEKRKENIGTARKCSVTIDRKQQVNVSKYWYSLKTATNAVLPLLFVGRS